MKKEYLNIHIRIEDTDRNKKVLNYFTNKVNASPETKGEWFVKMIYKFYLSEDKQKQIKVSENRHLNKDISIIKKVKKLFKS